MLRLLIARHGQTAWNLSLRNQGHTDVPLDETGIAQANQLADSLPHLDAMYCSDLVRAAQTAEPIEKRFGLKMVSDIRLRERNYGKWEGKTRDEVLASFPENHDSYHLDPTLTAPVDGETGIDVFCRVGYFISELFMRHQQGTILIVSHGGTIANMVAVLLHATPATASTLRFRNCSLTEFTIESNGRRKFIRLDDVAHLSLGATVSSVG